MLNRLLNLWLKIVSILVLWVLPIKHAGPSSWGLEFSNNSRLLQLWVLYCRLEYILYRYILVKELNCFFFVNFVVRYSYNIVIFIEFEFEFADDIFKAIILFLHEE